MTTEQQPNPFLDFVERYSKDPALFVKEVLGGTPTPYQEEALAALAKGERKMSIRSGHGTGKSTFASWAMLWYLTFRYPCKIVVTAPTTGQLFDALFAELKRWISEMPGQLRPLFNVKSDRVELTSAPSEAFISARTSRAETPEALAGVHSENVLLVVDEASGVPEPVFEAAAGSMSGHSATTLLLGNPTRSSGTFFESQTRMAASWWVRRWSCLDSPLVSDDFVAEIKLRYGEDSNAFRIRVLGEFPLADDDTIIPFHLADAASKRDIEVPEGLRPVWALDVARFGGDRTVLCKRTGAVVTDIEGWSGLDLMQTVGRVKAEYDGCSFNMRPTEILIDSIGLGAGVVDRLRELGLPVRGVNVSESPSIKGTYSNLRTELWFRVRGWLEERGSRIPQNDELIAELTSIRYTYHSSGKMAAESKDQMKRRGLKSPDFADALCLSMAGEAATAMGVRSTSWGQPLRRNLQGIA